MSKNKHGDLFNTSLSEVIIILFFVLMLFAIFNISKVNEENVALGNEVDDLTFEVDDLKFEKDNLKKIAEANNDPLSLGPINIELTLQIGELEREMRELEKEILKLNPAYISKNTQGKSPINPPNDPLTTPPDEPETTSPEEPLVAGNCIDKTFWRQCAEWAWPVNIERKPPVEFLFDIGMCSNGDIVVIKSDWKSKREMDFILVDGASTITDKMYIKRNEIIEFMSLIHDKSLDFKEGQTQHISRLINLELIDTDVSKFPRKAIEDEMAFIPTTRFDKKYEQIKERFPENACNFFKPTKPAKEDILQEPPAESLEINIKPNIPDFPYMPDISESSKALFEWDNDITCNRASGKRTSEFNATFYVLVTASSRVKVLDYKYQQTNKNNRLLMLDAKASIERQRKNIKPAMNSDNPEDNKLSFTRVFPKDICR